MAVIDLEDQKQHSSMGEQRMIFQRFCIGQPDVAHRF
jgi:hypothetical protein